MEMEDDQCPAGRFTGPEALSLLDGGCMKEGHMDEKLDLGNL